MNGRQLTVFMGYYDYGYGYPPYVSVAQKKARNMKSLEKLKKNDPGVSPVIVEGRRIARTWWGKAWNVNLESYADYSNRIGRGRSYVCQGAVLDLKIFPGKVSALVQGSGPKPYKIDISIQPLSKSIWDSVTKACEGRIDSLQELLDGKFPKALAGLFTAHGKGLFPAPKEISLKCSCPDWATMCKHVAAVLYGIGARLDQDPSLFFVLRNVNIGDLVSKAIAQKTQTLLKKSGKKSGRVIDENDISGMFGIEMDDGPAAGKGSEAKPKAGAIETTKAGGKKKGRGRPKKAEAVAITMKAVKVDKKVKTDKTVKVDKAVKKAKPVDNKKTAVKRKTPESIEVLKKKRGRPRKHL